MNQPAGAGIPVAGEEGSKAEQLSLEQAVRDPERRRALLLQRARGLLLLSSFDVYADAQAAQALWQSLVLLTGHGLAPEIDHVAYIDDVRNSLRGLRPDQGEAAAAILEKTVAQHLDCRLSQSIADTPAKRARRLVWASGQAGAIISEGTVCILSGQGGVAKTTLALQLALHMAGNPGTRDVCGALASVGGPVLFLSYEDPPEECAALMHEMAYRIDNGREGPTRDAMDRVFVMRMKRRPLYGVPSGSTFNTRTTRQPGWHDLVREMERRQPTMVVIDPVLSAYSGDSNAGVPVRDFVDELSDLAEATDTGMLCVAHANKAARRSADNWDAGHIGGSAVWTDAARGVLILQSNEGQPVLRLPKANRGPQFLETSLRPYRANCGRILGFEQVGQWKHALNEGYNGQAGENVADRMPEKL